ncbi:hypothetical protein [Desulfococcus multivorans]|jgi:hypothetical protein|uniref:Uncharacterized protein n=1 Tax=Desulfococcus multivorans DSM 2059 TaxID=1121405 RepID=S7V8N7_DESML|nr:hypothetical protein [Desulfococcus multivorans]AOY59394.1 uncharacterized protein Dmul_26220 [Desulfococcus multivorans]AQV01605.1 hypothetical protein B2D07_13115 [Desulfococcus multivorans]EPR43054.1 hypothetical protein dsmv_1420 [Desulfococcus multivorans DSM 2059]SJZ99878.1 hypothetical protein SAMN02745446_02352 [Desulfococcus multivorans DSM 2059]
MPNIAVEGDVIAIPGTTPYPPAVSGAWVPGPVTCTGYSTVTVNGVGVIYEARCTFTFTGVGPTPPGNPVSGTEDVTLSAGDTAVNGSQSSVLLDGDSETGSYGNQLQVVAPANPAATG